MHTVEDAYDVMRSYEVHTTSKFVQVRTVQDFGKDLGKQFHTGFQMSEFDSSLW